MNSLSREFHELIICNEYDDLILLQGFISHYVLKGLTIHDFFNTLQDVYQVSTNKAVDIYAKLLEILSNYFQEGS